MPIVSATRITSNCAIGCTDMQAVAVNNQCFVIGCGRLWRGFFCGSGQIMGLVHISFTKIESDSLLRDLRSNCFIV